MTWRKHKRYRLQVKRDACVSTPLHSVSPVGTLGRHHPPMGLSPTGTRKERPGIPTSLSNNSLARSGHVLTPGHPWVME